MSAKKNNMPKFSFGPDDEYEERLIKLSKTTWAMLDKYCGFVEKKTEYRPSYEKVFGKLLDDLFGTDKAFRRNEGLMRTKKPSSKPIQDALNTSPAVVTVKPQEATANTDKSLAAPKLPASSNNAGAGTSSAHVATPERASTPSLTATSSTTPLPTPPLNRTVRTASSMPSSVPTQPYNSRPANVPQPLLDSTQRTRNS